MSPAWPTESSLPSVGFRRAGRGDREWLWGLKLATMKDYIAATFGWDESFQRHWFEEDFDPGRIRIIQVDGRDAGEVEIEEKADHFYLRQIEVLPAFQRQGIGRRVIRALIERAEKKNKPVRLQVLRVNPARALYERLGFVVRGETPTHYLMRRERGDGTIGPGGF